MAEAAHSYAYLARSGADPAGRRAVLQTSGGVTVAGPAANPRFFTGFLAGAEQAAAGLLAVADVAQARYYQPQRAGLRDPVVTLQRGPVAVRVVLWLLWGVCPPGCPVGGAGRPGP
jgi:hypothetical protein